MIMHQLLAKLVSHLMKKLDINIFKKLPRILGREIGNYWKSKNFKKCIGIGPRMVFTYCIVKEKCIQANIQKMLKSNRMVSLKKLFILHNSIKPKNI